MTLDELRGRCLELVVIDDLGPCWLYKASGFIAKKKGPYRRAYEIAKGPIPSGLCVCHACDMPLCCNPDHLWLGTYAENMADRSRKGRYNLRRQNRILPIELYFESGGDVIYWSERKLAAIARYFADDPSDPE
jgi:hypothetical protein